MKRSWEINSAIVAACILSLSLIGCEQISLDSSERNAITFLGQFAVDHEILPTKAMGIVTFSGSPYGILVDAYFRDLPSVGPIDLLFDRRGYCDNLRSEPMISKQDSDVYVWQVDTFDRGFGELHVLIPTHGTKNIGPVEQIHTSKYMAMVSRSEKPQVVVCLKNSIEGHPLASR